MKKLGDQNVLANCGSIRPRFIIRSGLHFLSDLYGFSAHTTKNLAPN